MAKTLGPSTACSVLAVTASAASSVAAASELSLAAAASSAASSDAPISTFSFSPMNKTW